MKTLITGAPGTGKTTLVEYARQHGSMNFFDTDKVSGLCEWREYATGKVIGDVEGVEPVGGEQWYRTNGWYWKQDKMNELLRSIPDPIVCGSADNVMDYYGAFDRIVLLHKSREDIVHNLTRPERDQANGKDPVHYDRILRWQEKLEESLKPFHADLVSDNTIPAMFERVQSILSKNDADAPIFTLHLPQYQIATEPDHRTVGKIVDDEIRRHFAGRTIVARGIGSSEHPGETIDELVEVIKRDGTDRYDANRKGDRYENLQSKHIDLFGFRRKVGPRMQLFKDVVYGFYHSALGIHGKAVRIDILIIYDAVKLKAVLHQYEGRTDKKRDGFVFLDPTHKQDALLGVVKIL